MKIIAIPDVHGMNKWKEIVVKEEKTDKIVFIGDYWDSFDIPFIEQLNNFRDIIEYKKANDEKVILLIGNHDGYIYNGMNQSGISGYQRDKAIFIQQEMQINKDLFQMCHLYNNTIFSHAGISPEWLDRQGLGSIENVSLPSICNFVNDLWKHKPIRFAFSGMDPYGDDTYQTPMWIRPKSLLRASEGFGETVNQVVGHTRGDSIRIETGFKDSKYYFIDCLDISDEYLVIENDEFRIENI